MQTLEDLLGEHPFFAGLGDEALALLAGCGHNVHLDTDAYLFRESDPANDFYLVRRGRIALELHAPARGSHTLETVVEGVKGSHQMSIRTVTKNPPISDSLFAKPQLAFAADAVQ